MHQINYKRKLIAFPLFPILLSLLHQLQTIHAAVPMGVLRIGDLSFLSLFCFYFSSPLLCLGKAQLLYSTRYSVQKFVVGVGSLC